MNKVLVANFKSNFTKSEAKIWLETFINIDKILLTHNQVILCPSFTLLPYFKDFISSNNLSIKLGAQNVSPFEMGAYTGEVNARQVKDFADFVLIGHSERKNLLQETNEQILAKVKASIANGLIPLFFVQKGEELIPPDVEFVVYEPPGSISGSSGGIPQDVSDVLSNVEKIKVKGAFEVLYGGSVSSENIKNFTSQSSISGALVGGASLEAEEFIKIIKNA